MSWANLLFSCISDFTFSRKFLKKAIYERKIFKLPVYKFMLGDICPVPSGPVFEALNNDMRVCAKLFQILVNSVMAENGRTDKRNEYGLKIYAKTLVPGPLSSTGNTNKRAK